MRKLRAYEKLKNEMYYQGEPDLETLQSFIFHHGDKEVTESIGLIGKTENGEREVFVGDYLRDSILDYEGKTVGYCHLPVVYDVNTCQYCVDTSFNKDGKYLVNIVEYFGKNLFISGNIFENNYKDLK